MKAMILAAGLGKRLLPFTLHHPKALYPVNGQPLLRHAIEHLKAYGIVDIVINVHHFAGQIRQYLDQNHGFGCTIEISDETNGLLETGGGVKNAARFFSGEEDFIVRNVDILSDLNFPALLQCHKQHAAMATLAVRRRDTSRYLLFDSDMQLSGWVNKKTGENMMVHRVDPPEAGKPGPLTKACYKELAFSGIQVLNSSVFANITEQGAFSLTQMYLRLAGSFPVIGFVDHAEIWSDMGSVTNG